MLFIKKIRADDYLREFINFCKNKYKDNLVAIVIYGSYAFGYFDKRKSDYDVFVIFKNKTLKGKKEINKKFPKISLQYFCTTNELIHKINQGHWSIYITLLKSARVLYKAKRYNLFLRRVKKLNFFRNVNWVTTIKRKTNFEKEALRKSKGYKAAKWALPSIRKRLQLLTYIRKKKIIWELKKIIKKNRDILEKEEIDFLIELDKKVKRRSEDFGSLDRKIAIKILDKLNKELLVKELSILK